MEAEVAAGRRDRARRLPLPALSMLGRPLAAIVTVAAIAPAVAGAAPPWSDPVVVAKPTGFVDTNTIAFSPGGTALLSWSSFRASGSLIAWRDATGAVGPRTRLAAPLAAAPLPMGGDRFALLTATRPAGLLPARACRAREGQGRAPAALPHGGRRRAPRRRDRRRPLGDRRARVDGEPRAPSQGAAAARARPPGPPLLPRPHRRRPAWARDRAGGARLRRARAPADRVRGAGAERRNPGGGHARGAPRHAHEAAEARPRRRRFGHGPPRRGRPGRDARGRLGEPAGRRVLHRPGTQGRLRGRAPARGGVVPADRASRGIARGQLRRAQRRPRGRP